MPKKRIFIGINDVSGFSLRFKNGFNKIGVEADFYAPAGHIYGFRTDKLIKYSENRLLRKIQKIALLTKMILKYDYFLFISPSSLLKDFQDVRLLRKFGKTTMMLFTGCDLRIPEKIAHYKWNPCSGCTQEYKDFVNCVIESKKKMIRHLEDTFDIIGAPFEAAGYLEKKYFNAIFPFDMDEFDQFVNDTYSPSNPIRIFHAPSNPVYKGSKFIIETVEKLKLQYDIEFICLQNVPYEEYKKKLSNADLIIDQMLLGSYGSVAIEGLLMNKPVISYLREDIWNVVDKDDCPIINANPDTLYSVLEEILKSPAKLSPIIQRGRKYVEKYHKDTVVAHRFLEEFENFRK
jgi:glycosyltransferase involved in cell wall biosynthesis